MHDSSSADRPTWIRGPQLRRRWGGMPVSTFYDRLSKGKLPPPEYPFGPATPHWRLADVEAHERQVHSDGGRISGQLPPGKGATKAEAA